MPPSSKPAAHHEQRARHEREHRGELRRAARIAQRQRRDHRAREQCDGRVGPDDHPPRGREERERDHRAERGIQSRLRATRRRARHTRAPTESSPRTRRSPRRYRRAARRADRPGFARGRGASGRAPRAGRRPGAPSRGYAAGLPDASGASVSSGVEHVAIAHVVADVQRDGEDDRVRQRTTMTSTCIGAARKQQREQREHHHRAASRRRRTRSRCRSRAPASWRARRAGSSQARAPAPASWNTTSAGAHQVASSTGTASTAENSIASCICVSAKRFAGLLLGDRCEPRHEVAQLAAVDDRRRLDRERHAEHEEHADGQERHHVAAEAVEELAHARERPPRSWLHAAASNPTASTGFSANTAQRPDEGHEVHARTARRGSRRRAAPTAGDAGGTSRTRGAATPCRGAAGWRA